MAASSRIRVAVAGATGYSGVELVRLLLRHPAVTLVRVTSEQYAGRPLASVYPSLRGRTELVLETLDAATVADHAEVVFTALPHGAAAATVAAALAAGARVLDLSADFRLQDVDTFRRWYGDHPAPELIAEAVYGVPEFHRERLRGARLVAVPGCYPTGALIGLRPLAQTGRIAGTVVVDSKSGASGAGRGAKTELLFCEVEESVRAYGVGKHRHQPEIEQELRAVGSAAPVIFTPHLLPIRRGILTTLYVPLAGDVDVGAAFRDAYAGERFVHLLEAGSFPDVRDVRGTNDVHVGWTWLPAAGTAVVVTAIDNLGKGAAGQAVQNLNVLLGIDEATGLEDIAAVP